MDAILERATGLLGNVALRGTMVLCAAVALAWLLRRRSASLRHLLWSGTIGALLLLPLGSVLLPPLRLPWKAAPRPAPLLAFPAPSPEWPNPPPWAPTKRALFHPDAQAARTEPVEKPTPSRHPLVALWAVGALLMLVRFGRARARAARLLSGTRAADPAIWPAPAGIEVREGGAIDLPMTVGALRPIVLMPAREGRRWSPAWRAAALEHEVAHLRRRDPLLEAAAELACCLYWFHPLMWLAARQLRTERELAADDDVLARGVPAAEYAELLVTLGCLPVTPPETGAVLPMLTPAGLKARLLGILDGRRRRGLPRAARFALVAAGLGLFVPTASAILVSRAPMPAGPVLACARDERTHQPVAGAEIDLWDGFALDDHLTAGPDGCFRWWHDQPPHSGALVVYARRGDLAGRHQILFAKEGMVLPVTVDMRPGQSISGRVRDEQGRPLVGAVARIVYSDIWARGPGPDAVAVSRSDGSFRLDGLLYGNFRLLFQSREGGFATAQVHLVGASIDGVEVTIGDARHAAGYLHDEAGRPVVGARVVENEAMAGTITSPVRDRHVDWDTSDENGAFRIAFVGRSLRAVGHDRDGHLVMATFNDWDRHPTPPRPGAWDGGRPMEPRTIVMKRAGMIAGSVRYPDGRPADHIFVHGMVGTLGPVRTLAMFENQTRTLTDDQGRFWVGPFPLGTITLTASAPPGGGLNGVFGADTVALVTDESTPQIDFVLEPGWKHPFVRNR